MNRLAAWALAFLLAAASAQELTWYEIYERGEKRFERGEYGQCLADMTALLETKPEPLRNQFTRAMQKVDYKPYYYMALCRYRLGDLDQAFELAQKAFAGEVVANAPALQANLAPILADYREQVQQLVQQQRREEALLEGRARILALISENRLNEAQRELDEVAPEDQPRFADIARYLARQRESENQYNDLLANATANLEGLLAREEAEKARALFDLMRDELPDRRALELERRIEAVERKKADEAAAAAAAEPEPEPDPEEIPAEPLPEAEPSDFEQRLSDIRQSLQETRTERDSLNLEVGRMRTENRRLQAELDRQASAQPAFEPKLFLALRQEDGLRLHVEGQAVSPLVIRDWRLSVNGRPLPAPASALDEDPFVIRIDQRFEAEGFGQHRVELAVVDELGRRAASTKAVTLQRPLLQRPWIWLLALAFALGLFLLGLRRQARRRKQALLRHFNPYIAGNPIRDQDMFYGRDALIQRIQGQVHNNSFMIHGNRRIGKTSLLLQLRKNLAETRSDRYRFYPVFIDLQGVEEANLFHHMMGEILLQAADWDVSLEGLSYADEVGGYQSRQFSRDLKRLIQRLQEGETRRVMLVLLMDEVDVLNEFGEKTNQKLRGVFMKDFAEHLTCVMAGIHLKKEWESAGSPWYNFFEEIPVTEFDRAAARALIVDPVKGVFHFKNDAVDRILDKTAGYPYLIQKVCVLVVGEKLKQNRFTITKRDVETALRNLNEEIKRNRGL